MKLPTRLLRELKKKGAPMKKELERIKRDLSATMLMLGRLIATNAVLSEILEKQRQEILYLTTGKTESDHDRKGGNNGI
jgi:flagellar biosynthesis/type III secretory pathway chaperone